MRTHFDPPRDDSARLAASIRSLAKQAHRALSQADACLDDLRTIQRRIGHLLDLVPGPSSNPLRHWLMNLREQVDEAQREACEEAAVR
jgi:hypothetical protein